MAVKKSEFYSSLKSQGKGACILPQGVLSYSNVEDDIREVISVPEMTQILLEKSVSAYCEYRV